MSTENSTSFWMTHWLWARFLACHANHRDTSIATSSQPTVHIIHTEQRVGSTPLGATLDACQGLLGLLDHGDPNHKVNRT